MQTFDKKYKEAEMMANFLHNGQSYDCFPYSKHLEDVVEILRNNGFNGDFIIAGWLHDSLEDCNISYNKIKNLFGFNVAEMVFAVTDPKARTREERKLLVYNDLIAYPKAIIIKLADRIANVKHAKRTGNSKLERYKKENIKFKEKLYPHTSDEGKILWDILEKSF